MILSILETLKSVQFYFQFFYCLETTFQLKLHNLLYVELDPLLTEDQKVLQTVNLNLTFTVCLHHLDNSSQNIELTLQ